MSEATTAEQEYLEIMFWIEEAGLPMTGANIARAMQLSPPTVHEMVGRLVDDGYVERNPNKSLAFTESGREHASFIVRRHRMIERFLTDVLGIPWDEVHEEAERIEHAMSPVLEEKMRLAIGDATTCPHGHPILEGIREQGSLLADVEVGADVTVLRFENEAEELLHYLRAAGLQPGLEGKLETSDDERVVIASADAKHEVSKSVAETVSVRADPAPAPRAAIPEQLVLSWTATAARAQPLTGRVTIGSEVGVSLPPCGSRVTITTSTPLMSSITVEALPSWSGTKSAGTASTSPSRWTQASSTRSSGNGSTFSSFSVPPRPSLTIATSIPEGSSLADFGCHRRALLAGAVAADLVADEGDGEQGDRRQRRGRLPAVGAGAEPAQPAGAALGRRRGAGPLRVGPHLGHHPLAHDLRRPQPLDALRQHLHRRLQPLQMVAAALATGEVGLDLGGLLGIQRAQRVGGELVEPGL